MTSKRYTDEDITKAVIISTSVRQVMLKIGMRLAGGSHTHLSRRIKKLDLDTSHFKGQRWSKGLKRGYKISSDEILVLKDTGYRPHGETLTRALINIGREYICEICGISAWNYLKLVLEVDHINRNWLDDRRENLRFLCPNCHSQTPKYCGSKGYTDLTSNAREHRERRKRLAKWRNGIRAGLIG